MNEEKFNEICEICDELLIRNLKHFRIVNTWLHPIREHPFFLEKYNRIICQSSIKTAVTDLILLARYIFSWSFYLIKILINININTKCRFNSGDKYDVLIISHLFDEVSLTKKDDLYFGDLSQKLQLTNLRTLTIYINHSENNILGESDYKDRLVLPTKQKKFIELRNICALLYETLSLMRHSYESNTDLKRKMIRRVAIESLSGSTRMTCRIGDQINDIVKFVKPRCIITTYEGHAWERVVAARAKENNPDIKWLAYQHGNLFRLQHSLRRSLGRRYDPDAIFCSGIIPLLDLTSSLKIPNPVLFNMGSPRVNSQTSIMINVDNKSKDKTLLIVPDGIESEIIFLYKFTLDCAALRPDCKFIFRLHPSNSLDELVRKHKEMVSLPPNITISELSLYQDAVRSSWVIYRGSSAVIPAIINGCKPVYLAKKNDMNINPLYGLKDKILSITNSKDLFDFVQSRSNFFYSKDNLEEIKKFCGSIYTPWCPEIMVKYICNLKF